MATRANLVEIFASIQGETSYVGATTVFVRFGGCDLRCRWCDSEHTWSAPRQCRIEREPGSGRFDERPNPVDVADVVAALDALDVDRASFVSATGGEPLLQPKAVAALGSALRGRPARFWLETHGLHHRALAEVVDVVDVVSMDWKLESDVRRASGDTTPFEAEHRAFLEVARRAPECLVKIVVTPATGDAEWERACRAIAAIDPAIPLVVQPVTPVSNALGGVAERPSAARLFDLQRRAEAQLRSVRVIPQTHPILGAL